MRDDVRATEMTKSLDTPQSEGEREIIWRTGPGTNRSPQAQASRPSMGDLLDLDCPIGSTRGHVKGQRRKRLFPSLLFTRHPPPPDLLSTYDHVTTSRVLVGSVGYILLISIATLVIIARTLVLILL